MPSLRARGISAYLTRAEGDLIAKGHLRRDMGREIAFDRAALVRDFIQIAFFDEYTPVGERLAAQSRSAPLRRWQKPVRVEMITGAATPDKQARRDRQTLAALTRRLQKATGHPVRLVKSGGNFTVLIWSEDERMRDAGRLARIIPGLPPRDIEAIRNLSPAVYCTAFAYSDDTSPAYSRALAVIRAELPPRLRQSCLHEEVAQGLGLANDSPTARPSIFNDDEEFALLTDHDALLLRMLYDPRLRPGMTLTEAEPILHIIAAELIPAPHPAKSTETVEQNSI